MTNFEHIWTEENHYYYDLKNIFLNYGERSKKKFGFGIKEAFLFAHDNSLEFFLAKDEIAKTADFGLEYFSNRESVEKFIADAKKAQLELEEECVSQIAANFFELENQELWDKFDYLGFKTGQLFLFYIMTQPQKTKKIEEKIQSEGNENITYNLTSVGKEFSADFSKKLEEIELKNEYFEEKLFDKHGEEDRLPESANPKYFSSLINLLGNLRFEMRFAWMKAGLLTRLYLKEIIKRGNISSSDLAFYEEEAIKDLLFSGKKISGAILKDRQAGYLLVLENEKIVGFEGVEALDQYKKITTQPSENIKEFKGVCASPGRAVGQVVLLSYTDASDHAGKIEKMPESSVLVTQMTRPNILTACKRALAIVTDEGGLLCHAAIVSRELHIPCVIGTKIATKVLKDGDEVEVDADNGTIKILEGIK
jgi:phosphohistidine swiveling domain-containing protein